MINLFNFLQKDVSSLKRLEKTIKNGDNGIFYDFYCSVADAERERKNKGYRDIYYYKRLVDGVTVNTIKFYTKLVQVNNQPKIIVCKIEIY